MRSNRNILLDRVEFERCRQKEGEDFENFYINVQQCAIDANLSKEHCNACKKLCLEARMENKLMAGLKDREVRTKLLQLGEEDYILENIVKISKINEHRIRGATQATITR